MMKGNEQDCICAKQNGKHSRECDAYLSLRAASVFSSNNVSEQVCICGHLQAIHRWSGQDVTYHPCSICLECFGFKPSPIPASGENTTICIFNGCKEIIKTDWPHNGFLCSKHMNFFTPSVPHPPSKPEADWEKEFDLAWAKDDVPRLRRYAKAFIAQQIQSAYEQGAEEAFKYGFNYRNYRMAIRAATFKQVLGAVGKQRDWFSDEKQRSLQAEQVMLAYDMDSRFVAAKQILEAIEELSRLADNPSPDESLEWVGEDNKPPKT